MIDSSSSGGLGQHEIDMLIVGPQLERLIVESIMVSFLREAIISQGEVQSILGPSNLNEFTKDKILVELEFGFAVGKSFRTLTIISKPHLAAAIGLSPDSVIKNGYGLNDEEIDQFASSLDTLIQNIQASASTLFPTPSGEPLFGLQIIGLGDDTSPIPDWINGQNLLMVSHQLSFSDPDLADSLVVHVFKPDFISQFTAEAISASAGVSKAIPQKDSSDMARIVDDVVANTQKATHSASAKQKKEEMAAEPSVTVRPAEFTPLTPTEDSALKQGIDLILDVPLTITVELGRANMMIKDVLNLGQGSVIQLDKLAGEPVDIMVNDRLIAKGEVVVVDENFGVRVTEIITRAARNMAIA